MPTFTFFVKVGVRGHSSQLLIWQEASARKCPEPEQWRWSSYPSYSFGEEGAVKLNQQREIKIKLPPQAA